MKRSILLALLIGCVLSTFAQVDFRKESIYFLITSRFYDGDSTNNAATEWCSYFPGNPNNGNYSGPKDVTWRGDFRGLIQKLDYIKDLGFTAIWITPIVQNRGPLDYHGYHAWDFTKVDNRLLSPGAGFQDLINAAHAKGIKIILDIVTNHAGRFGIKGVAELKYNTDPAQSWGKDKNGNTLQDNPNWKYDGLTPNPDDNKIWSRANLAKMPSPYNQNLANYNWPSTESFVNTSDPNWYHHWGNGFVQGWDDTLNCYNGAIAGDCPDLNTGSQAVQDYLFNAYKQYIDMGIDAIRWDTWKHMNKADIFSLMDRFKALNPNLFIFGEVAQKRFDLHSVQELNPHWYTWRGAVNGSQPSGASVIDFYGEATFHNIFQNGGGFSGVTDAARYDNLYADPSQLVTWLDNHDFGPNNDWNMRYSGTDENLAACMNFMFTWRGIPSVYYGTEMRFKAGAYTDLHDAAGINQSLEQTGRAYFGDAMANASNHIIYKHIKRLNAIRKAIPALQNGNWSWGGNGPGNAIGYTRRSGASFVVVGLAKDGSAGFNFTGIDNGVYRDAVTGRVATVTNGNLSFTVTSGSAGIYVLNGPGMIGENGGFFENCVICSSTPVVKISPNSGNYSSPVTVTLTSTGGSTPYTIYYTNNGSAPTTASTRYTTPLLVNARTIIRAIAVDAAGKISEIDGQQYTFEVNPINITTNPPAGNYYTAQTVSLAATGGAGTVKLYYTTNGTTPTTSSSLYATALSISSATTLNVLAVDSLSNQKTFSAAYTFNIPAPIVTASPASGNYPSPPVTVTLSASSPKPPVRIYYTTDGSNPTTSSSLYSSAFSVAAPGPKVVRYIGVDADGRTSTADSVKYTFNPIPDIWVYFKKPAAWANAKIHYWNPLPAGAVTATSWPGVDMTLHCGDWYKFKFSGVTSVNLIFNSGTGTQTPDLSVGTTSYYDNGWLSSVPNMCSSNTPPVVSISPASSNFSDSLLVTLTVSDDKPGSIIYYTTNGSTATASSTLYTAPFWVKNTTTVNATAKDADNAMAANVSASYTKQTTAGNITVYFENTAGWAQPKVYCWSPTPSTYSACTAWPGTNMTKVANCGNWWTYTFSGVNGINLIFNDGGTTNKTADLSLGAPGTYNYSWTSRIWGSGLPNCNTPPVVSINPASSNFTDSVLVTLSVIDDKPGSIIYYTTNGSTATASSSVYTVPFWIKNTATVNATAKDVDNAMALNVSATYTKQVPAGNITVYFENTAGWAQPKLYCWSPSPSTYSGCTAWPGNNMTKVANCGNWWVYTYTGVNSVNMIFNNGSGTQSVDLSRTAPGIYNYSWTTKAWANGTPVCNTPPVVSINPASSNFTDSLLVTLSVADDKAGSIIYYTINGSAATASSTIYTAPFWVKATTTVNATAKDADNAMAVNVSSTYNRITGITVYFENTGAWSQPKVYCWSPIPSGYAGCIAWPGSNMTKVNACGNWWSYTFAGVTATNLIFNSGTGVQSADLNLAAAGTYKYSWTTKVWSPGSPGCTGARMSMANKIESHPFNVTVVPNPVTDATLNLHIDVPENDMLSICIFDARGIMVKKQEGLIARKGVMNLRIPLSRPTAGYYAATIQYRDEVIPVKFMVK